MTTPLNEYRAPINLSPRSQKETLKEKFSRFVSPSSSYVKAVPVSLPPAESFRTPKKESPRPIEPSADSQTASRDYTLTPTQNGYLCQVSFEGEIINEMTFEKDVQNLNERAEEFVRLALIHHNKRLSRFLQLQKNGFQYVESKEAALANLNNPLIPFGKRFMFKGSERGSLILTQKGKNRYDGDPFFMELHYNHLFDVKLIVETFSIEFEASPSSQQDREWRTGVLKSIKEKNN